MRPFGCIALTLAVCFPVPPSIGRAAEVGQRPPDRIEGVVLFPDGQPAANAPVVLSHNRVHAQVRTRSDGTFALAVDAERLVLESGEERWRMASLVSHVDGFGIALETLRNIEPGQSVTLQLVEDVPIRGRVLDQQGRPLEGARLNVITLHDPTEGDLDGFLQTQRDSPFRIRYHMVQAGYRGVSPRVFSVLKGESKMMPMVTISDAEGNLELRGLGRERVVYATIQHPNIVSEFLWVVTRSKLESRWKRGPVSEDAQRHLSMGFLMPVVQGAEFRYLGSPGLTMTGTLSAANGGQPIGGMSVQGRAGTRPQAVATSDEDGNFELQGLPMEGKVQLSVSNPGGLPWLDASRNIRVRADRRPKSIHLQLDRGVVVTGRVLDDNGQPVSGSVTYLAVGQNPQLRKLHNNYGARFGTSTGKDGNYSLVVPHGPGTLSFTAYDRHKYGTAQPDDFGFPVVRSQGRAEFSTENMGIVSADRFTVLKRIDVDVDQSAINLDLAVTTGPVIRARLTKADGSPIKRFMADFPFDGSLGQRHGEGLREGSLYELSGLQPDQRQMVLFRTPDRKWAALRELQLPENQDAEPMEIQLRACGTIIGHLADTEGDPLTEWTLAVRSEDFSRRKQPQTPGRRIGFSADDGAKTDLAGYFRLQGIPPNARAEIYASASEGNRVPIHVKTVTLRAGQMLELGVVTVNETE